MKKRWEKLSAKDKKLMLAMLFFVIIGAYFGLIYKSTNAAYQESVNMLHRRMNRIATRAKSTMVDITTNPKTLEKKIENIDLKISHLISKITAIETGFIPIDSSEKRQSLLVELSTLAHRSGLHLQNITSKGTPLSLEETASVVDPHLLRPLLRLSARSSFWSLLAFLDGLKDLSNIVSVNHIEFQFQQQPTKKETDSTPGAAPFLEITLELII